MFDTFSSAVSTGSSAAAAAEPGFIKEFFSAPKPGLKGFMIGGKKGYNLAFKGNLVPGVLLAAYAGATAPRGHKLSAVSGSGTGWGVSAIMGGAIAGAFGMPPQIGALAAGVIFGNGLDAAISSSVQSAVDFGSNMRKVRFGGDYRDTQTAVTMRQAASREMSRSLMNARQWLGQEGAFMHQ